MVDDWDLRRTGRSRVKDAEGPDAPGGRRIVVTGELRSGEIRVRRGGIAMLSAMFSRAYWDDLRRRTRRAGSRPWTTRPARPDNPSLTTRYRQRVPPRAARAAEEQM